MLNHLSIKNVAVIDKLSVDLHKGVSVLTGETGAGKSIIIDSINMILGDRANKELVRYGAEKAVVQAVFDTNKDVLGILEENDIDIEDDEIIITRQLTSEGKSTARINGTVVTLNVLREIADGLINIHGQHDSQALLTPVKHVSFLDAYAENDEYISEYREYLRKKHETEKKIAALKMDEQEKERRIDLLEYQLEEITKASLEKGEEEDLKEQREIYANAEQITNAVNEAYFGIYGGDNAAYDNISLAVQALSGVSNVNPRIKGMYDALSAVMYSLEDVAHEVKDFGDGVEFDEKALNDVEERLDLISKLKRKYGATIDDILDYLKNARNELNDIKLSDERIQELRKELDDITAGLSERGRKLSERRKEYAFMLEKNIEQSLHELNMEHSKFKVNVETNDDFYENGIDRVEFLISTNPGEPLKPLVKIASGGELSRVMLAIKSILADSDGVDTLIFDEIDTGVSGKAAMSIARKLSEIGRNKQVICITHLPQLTASADNHYLIQKDTDGDMAYTTLTELDDKQRETELARIIDGGEATELALSHAREMLMNARKGSE